MNSDKDKVWLLARLDHVNESQIEYFVERVSVLCDNGMDEKQARPAALILLIDFMRK